jgi:molybdopterin converting factor small subunit
VGITLKLGAPVLQAITDGQEVVHIAEVATLKDVLKGLEDQYPGVAKHLYDETGDLKSTYDVYINDRVIDQVTLSAKIADGDEVVIAMFFCFPRS